MSEDMRVRCTCGETACESELCDCDATPCPVNHRAEEAEAEVARLRAGWDALKADNDHLANLVWQAFVVLFGDERGNSVLPENRRCVLDALDATLKARETPEGAED